MLYSSYLELVRTKLLKGHFALQDIPNLPLYPVDLIAQKKELIGNAMYQYTCSLGFFPQIDIETISEFSEATRTLSSGYRGDLHWNEFVVLYVFPVLVASRIDGKTKNFIQSYKHQSLANLEWVHPVLAELMSSEVFHNTKRSIVGYADARRSRKVASELFAFD